VNAGGNELWRKTYSQTYTSGGYPQAYNHLQAAVATSDGGFLLAGQTTQNVPGSTAVGTYGLLVKVDVSGNDLWPKPYTVPLAAGLTSTYPQAAVALPGGGVLLAGSAYQSPGTPVGNYGWAARVDSVDSDLLLQQADGTAQAADKAFRLLWQPILTVGGLDSLARPQLRGTVTTFPGGRVPLPPAMQVKDSKGFYFFQEASPATGQDTLFYGLYVRNTPLANGAKDDTLRHLYQCRRSFGSQAGLLGGALQPLTLGSSSTAPRVAPATTLRSPLTPRAALTRPSRQPTAPQRPAPLAKPQPALPIERQRAR
jgi:hypothetical protein